LLDASERYPDHYDRVEVVVETESGPAPCWVYKAQPDKIREDLVPSRNYLNHILAERDALSQTYFEALHRSQTYQAECRCCEKVGEILFLREGKTLHGLCQACREARTIWGDVYGRPLTISETEAVMKQLVLPGPGFASFSRLIDEAIRRGLIEPRSGQP
jgi:hypothetical protein